MLKLLILGLVFTFSFIQTGCQEEPPDIDKGEAGEELGIIEPELQPIEDTHQALNEAVCWDRIPDADDYENIVNNNIPQLKKLKENVGIPELERDLGRVIEIFQVELSGVYTVSANANKREDVRELWVEAHRIMHDLDWGLLGNEPSDKTYYGYSEYLEK